MIYGLMPLCPPCSIANNRGSEVQDDITTIKSSYHSDSAVMIVCSPCLYVRLYVCLSLYYSFVSLDPTVRFVCFFLLSVSLCISVSLRLSASVSLLSPSGVYLSLHLPASNCVLSSPSINLSLLLCSLVVTNFLFLATKDKEPPMVYLELLPS